MSARYVLAPQAVQDLFDIWRHFGEVTSVATADRIESTILERIARLAAFPGAGHRRADLTDQDVRFYSVYSYLIVYRPETTPLQIVTILHGRRDVERILGGLR